MRMKQRDWQRLPAKPGNVWSWLSPESDTEGVVETLAYSVLVQIGSSDRLQQLARHQLEQLQMGYWAVLFE